MRQPGHNRRHLVVWSHYTYKRQHLEQEKAYGHEGIARGIVFPGLDMIADVTLFLMSQNHLSNCAMGVVFLCKSELKMRKGDGFLE